MSHGPAFDAFDERAMARALELAARGLNSTDPNPRVGCVVAHDAHIVGEGFHERRGGPHAETLALREAGARAAGSTVYVTLEPCSHHGRTPPCADALVEAGVRRVVYAVGDPDPRVNGGGARRLREAGVRVESGLLAREAQALNVGFLRRMRTGRPWVRLKQATSLDGRIALADGTSRWITGETARADVHRWRARSSAVLTGVDTVLADDPALTARPEGAAARQPLRIVLDRELRTPAGARLLGEPGATRIFSGPAVDSSRRAALEARGAIVESLPLRDGRIDLTALIERLVQLEVNELWVESGPRLAGAFLAGRLVDEWILYVAPCLLGSDARPVVELEGLRGMRDRPEFELVETARFGADLRMILHPRNT